MKRLSTHFLVLIILLGTIGILNSFWVFLNYSSMSDAYENVAFEYEKTIIQYSREIANSIEVDTLSESHSIRKSSEFELLIEPYYEISGIIYLLKDEQFYLYKGINLNKLKQLSHYKNELSYYNSNETVNWLNKFFAFSTLLILIVGFFIYRFYTEKFKQNINQLMLAIKKPEIEGHYDFLELDEIQKSIRKYHIISTQAEKQSMVVDLMSNWKLEIKKLIHDLKNPIQRLMLSVSNQANSDVAISSIEEINQKLKELRSNDGADEIDPKEINLDQFFTRLKSLFYDIKIEIKHELTQPFIFDEFGFQRIASNLIQNAVEAGATEITFHLFEIDGKICCEIINNGNIIKSREKLFIPFATTKKHGTGLGLVIMLQIVHAHNGQFFLKKSDELSTVFSIQLPLKESIENQ